MSQQVPERSAYLDPNNEYKTIKEWYSLKGFLTFQIPKITSDEKYAFKMKHILTETTTHPEMVQPNIKMGQICIWCTTYILPLYDLIKISLKIRVCDLFKENLFLIFVLQLKIKACADSLVFLLNLKINTYGGLLQFKYAKILETSIMSHTVNVIRRKYEE